MQHADESQLRQLLLRVQEELTQARADLERTNGPDLGDRLDEIERELTSLQGSRSLLFRGRRRRTVLGLLLSERLLLDDLGFDSYADYVGAGVEGRSPESDGGTAHAKVARVELADALQRLTDIENGVLDLDWLASGSPEPSLFERPEVAAVVSARRGDRSSGAGAPLEAWRNPFAVETEPSTTTRPPSKLPRLGGDEPPPADLPYWNKNESA
jgi:hypothetical protein